MSDLQPNSDERLSPSENHTPLLSKLPPSSDQKLIEIQIASKKKKEIINLESSSQRNIDRSSLRENRDQMSGSTPAKPVKVKKIMPKCQLCKGTGKKVEMKNCTTCKNSFHLSCLDQNEVKKKYVCDKCRAQQQFPESKITKKAKKQQNKIEQQNALSLPSMFSNQNLNNFPKLTQKKLEKEKKKDESNKTFLKFRQKYPYYINDNNKIKFPIEDKLLFIYRDYFQSNENLRTNLSPPIDHPTIPSRYLGDFLELQNFIVSFYPEFTRDYYGEYKKSALYSTMKCDGTDRIFEQLLGAIIKIYMKDIYEKNKTQNVKILNDHCFFILLGTMNQGDSASSQLIARIAQEIIRHLSTVPSMKDAFKNFEFPKRLTLQSKLSTLITLIQGLSQVDGFHDMVSRKSQKISEMTKDKAEYVAKLKQNQAEALSNKQKLKQIQGKMDIEVPEVENDNGDNKKKNIIKEAEKNKKKSHKLSLQHENSSKLIKQYKEKIVRITKTIPFTISEVMFLGTDRNKSHHYFYLRQPNHVYVRYHSYLLDENEEFKMYEGKQKIIQFMKTLNNKGINEKHLLENLTFLIKQDILRNPSPQELAQEMEIEDNGNENYEGSFIETQEEFRQKIIKDVMEMQEKFTNYLTVKSCRWANETKREEFKIGFPYIDNIQSMKEAVKTLQENFLFVEVVREQEQRNGESDSHNEQGDKNAPQQKQTLRRRKPIRIWGINSERIKKFWLQYLELCVDYVGIWITVNIFKNFVDKYLDKKLESIREQERRETLEREKENKRKLREARERELQEKKAKQIKQKSRFTRSMKEDDDEDEQQIQVQEVPRRSLRSNNRGGNENQRRKPLTIDSDDENEYDDLKNDEQNVQEDEFMDEDEESNNDDECGICREVGDVICCDTCPKVYHLACLKLKEVPEGEWSCMECLQKMANTRQTRSRAKMFKE